MLGRWSRRAVEKLTPRRRRPVLICAGCELTGGPFEPDEHAHLVALHQELHHGQRRPAPVTGPGPSPGEPVG